MNDQDSLKWHCGEVQLVACVVLLLLMLGSDNGSSWVGLMKSMSQRAPARNFE
jgi:hypothetical protein